MLIAEDHDDLRDNLRDLLEDEGYDVVVARDGEEALRQLDMQPASLVVLDLLLPLRNGYEVYDAMQRDPRLENIPVLVTSTDPTRAPPGLPMMEKPVDADAFLRFVAMACRKT